MTWGYIFMVSFCCRPTLVRHQAINSSFSWCRSNVDRHQVDTGIMSSNCRRRSVVGRHQIDIRSTPVWRRSAVGSTIGWHRQLVVVGLLSIWCLDDVARHHVDADIRLTFLVCRSFVELTSAFCRLIVVQVSMSSWSRSHVALRSVAVLRGFSPNYLFKFRSDFASISSG